MRACLENTSSEGATIADEGIEQRLFALESTVARIQIHLAKAPSADWIEKITGSVSGDEAFQEAPEFGRACRAIHRAKDETEDSEEY